MGRMPAGKARRNQYVDRLADQFLPLVPKEPFGLAIDQQHPAVAVRDDHRVGRRVKKATELGLELPVLRAVAYRRNDQPALLDVQWAEADFHPELRPVLPVPLKIETRHWSRLRIGPKLSPFVKVDAAKALRHERFNGLSDERVRLVPEEGQGVGIGHQNPPIAADNDHRVRRRVE
jgi:hypothetical protein